MNVLEFLYGLPYNEITKAYISGVRPSSVRICDEDTPYLPDNWVAWRVTVYLKKNKITKINQEVNLDLSNSGVTSDHDLDLELKKLKDKEL